MSDDSDASLPLPGSPAAGSGDHPEDCDSGSDHFPIPPSKKIILQMSSPEEASAPSPSLPLDEIPYPTEIEMIEKGNMMDPEPEVEIPLPPDSSDSKYSPSQASAEDASPASETQQKKTVAVLGRAQAMKRLKAFSAAKLAATSTTGGSGVKKSPIKGVSVFSGKSSSDSKQPPLAIASIKEEETKMREILAMNSLLNEKLKTVHAITGSIPGPGPATAIVKPTLINTEFRNTSDNLDKSDITIKSSEDKITSFHVKKQMKNIRRKRASSSSSASRSRSKSPGVKRRVNERRSRSRDRDKDRDRDRDSYRRDRDRDRARERDRESERKRVKRSRSRSKNRDHDRRRSKSPRSKDKSRRKSRSRSRERRRRSRSRERKKSPSRSASREKEKEGKHRDRSPSTREVKRKSLSPQPLREKKPKSLSPIPLRKSRSRSLSRERRKSRSRSKSVELKMESKKKSRSRSREREGKSRRKSPSKHKKKDKDRDRERDREREKEKLLEKERREKEEKKEIERKRERERQEAAERELDKVRTTRMPVDWKEYKKFQYCPDNVRDVWNAVLRDSKARSRSRSSSRSPSRAKELPSSPLLSRSLMQSPKLIKTVQVEMRNSIKRDYPIEFLRTTRQKPPLEYGVNRLTLKGYYQSRDVFKEESPEVVRGVEVIINPDLAAKTSPAPPDLPKIQPWFAEHAQLFCPSEGSKGIVISHLYSDEEMEEAPPIRSKLTAVKAEKPSKKAEISAELPSKSVPALASTTVSASTTTSRPLSQSEPVEEEYSTESSQSQDSVPSPLLKTRYGADLPPLPTSSLLKVTEEVKLRSEEEDEDGEEVEELPVLPKPVLEPEDKKQKTKEKKKDKKKKKKKDSKKHHRRHRKDSKKNSKSDDEEDSGDKNLDSDSSVSEDGSKTKTSRKKKSRKDDEELSSVKSSSKLIPDDSKKKSGKIVSSSVKTSKKHIKKSRKGKHSESDESEQSSTSEESKESSSSSSGSESDEKDRSKKKKKRAHKKKRDKKDDKEDSSDDETQDRGDKGGAGGSSRSGGNNERSRSHRRDRDKDTKDRDKERDRRRSKDRDRDRDRSDRRKRRHDGLDLENPEDSVDDSQDDSSSSPSSSSSYSSSHSNSSNTSSSYSSANEEDENGSHLDIHPDSQFQLALQISKIQQIGLEDKTENDSQIISKLLNQIEEDEMKSMETASGNEKYDPYLDVIADEHVKGSISLPGKKISGGNFNHMKVEPELSRAEDLLKTFENDPLLQMVLTDQDLSAENLLAQISEADQLDMKDEIKACSFMPVLPSSPSKKNIEVMKELPLVIPIPPLPRRSENVTTKDDAVLHHRKNKDHVVGLDSHRSQDYDAMLDSKNKDYDIAMDRKSNDYGVGMDQKRNDYDVGRDTRRNKSFDGRIVQKNREHDVDLDSARYFDKIKLSPGFDHPEDTPGNLEGSRRVERSSSRRSYSRSYSRSRSRSRSRSFSPSSRRHGRSRQFLHSRRYHPYQDHIRRDRYRSDERRERYTDGHRSREMRERDYEERYSRFDRQHRVDRGLRERQMDFRHRDRSLDEYDLDHPSRRYERIGRSEKERMLLENHYQEELAAERVHEDLLEKPITTICTINPPVSSEPDLVMSGEVSPPLRLNVADSTISDSDLADNIALGFVDHVEDNRASRSYLKEIIPQTDSSVVTVLDSSSTTAVPGYASPPKRLSLDERLEMEMGIKLREEVTPAHPSFPFSGFPTGQGEFSVKSGVNQAPSADSAWLPQVPVQGVQAVAPEAARTAPRQSQAIPLGDLIQVLPGQMLDRSFTVTKQNSKLNPFEVQQTATQIIRKVGDEMDPKKCVNIKVPVLPFKIPVFGHPDLDAIQAAEQEKENRMLLRQQEKEQKRLEKNRRKHEKQKQLLKRKMKNIKKNAMMAKKIQALEAAKRERDEKISAAPESNNVGTELESATTGVDPEELKLLKEALTEVPTNPGEESDGNVPASTEPELIRDKILPVDDMNEADEREDDMETVNEPSSPKQPNDELPNTTAIQVKIILPKKGILYMTGLKKEKSSKGVKFADGVLPGFGSSRSECEDIHSPPPGQENIIKKKKKKVKVKEKKKKTKPVVEIESNAPKLPPPPPPKEPYPYCPLGILYQFNPPYAIVYAQTLAELGYEVTFTPSMETPKDFAGEQLQADDSHSVQVEILNQSISSTTVPMSELGTTATTCAKSSTSRSDSLDSKDRGVKRKKHREHKDIDLKSESHSALDPTSSRYSSSRHKEYRHKTAHAQRILTVVSSVPTSENTVPPQSLHPVDEGRNTARVVKQVEADTQLLLRENENIISLSIHHEELSPISASIDSNVDTKSLPFNDPTGINSVKSEVSVESKRIENHRFKHNENHRIRSHHENNRIVGHSKNYENHRVGHQKRLSNHHVDSPKHLENHRLEHKLSDSKRNAYEQSEWKTERKSDNASNNTNLIRISPSKPHIADEPTSKLPKTSTKKTFTESFVEVPRTPELESEKVSEFQTIAPIPIISRNKQIKIKMNMKSFNKKSDGSVSHAERTFLTGKINSVTTPISSALPVPKGIKCYKDVYSSPLAPSSNSLPAVAVSPIPSFVPQVPSPQASSSPNVQIPVLHPPTYDYYNQLIPPMAAPLNIPPVPPNISSAIASPRLPCGIDLTRPPPTFTSSSPTPAMNVNNTATSPTFASATQVPGVRITHSSPGQSRRPPHKGNRS